MIITTARVGQELRVKYRPGLKSWALCFVCSLGQEKHPERDTVKHKPPDLSLGIHHPAYACPGVLTGFCSRRMEKSVFFIQ